MYYCKRFKTAWWLKHYFMNSINQKAIDDLKSISDRFKIGNSFIDLSLPIQAAFNMNFKTMRLHRKSPPPQPQGGENDDKWTISSALRPKVLILKTAVGTGKLLANSSKCWSHEPLHAPPFPSPFPPFFLQARKRWVEAKELRVVILTEVSLKASFLYESESRFPLYQINGILASRRARNSENSFCHQPACHGFLLNGGEEEREGRWRETVCL